MDFVKDLFSEHGAALTEKLSGAGFSADQASQFLPEAASGIMGIAQNASVAQMVSGFGSGQLLNSLDIGGIASKLGMSTEQVSSGFDSIMPVITKAFTENSGGIASLMGGSAGGMLGAAKKLFG